MAKKTGTAQLIINRSSDGVVNVLPKQRGKVQIWFQDCDGDCSLSFTQEQWEKLDNIVRGQFGIGQSVK